MYTKQQLLDRSTPSNWTVLSNNGATLTAVNNITKETFNGTPVAFKALTSVSGTFGNPEPVFNSDGSFGGFRHKGVEFPTSVPGTGKKAYRAGVALIANPTALSDYTIGGSPVTAEIVTREGRKAIRLVTNGTNACDVQVSIKRPRTFGGRGSVTCEFPKMSDWGGGSLSLQLSVDGSYVNRMAASLTFASNNLFPGIQNYTAQRIGTIAAPSRFLEWDGFGTVADNATMHNTVYNFARVRVTPGAAATGGAEVFLFGAWVDEMDEAPSALITTDDCDASIYTLALPILERYGLRCSFGYIHDKVMAGGSAMTVAQCQDAFGRGHEFNTHGMKNGFNSIRDYNKNIALIKDDVTYQRDGLRRNGLARNDSENIYVWAQGFFRADPQGNAANYDDLSAVQAIKELGFIGARLASFQGGRPEPISWRDARYFIPILGHNYNYSGNEANNMADLIDRTIKAAEDGLSYPVMFHIITTGTPTLSEQIQRGNFEAYCEAVAHLCATGKAVNRTMSEHVKRLNAAFGVS